MLECIKKFEKYVNKNLSKVTLYSEETIREIHLL